VTTPAPSDESAEHAGQEPGEHDEHPVEHVPVKKKGPRKR
jgi:hypothetical protein